MSSLFFFIVINTFLSYLILSLYLFIYNLYGYGTVLATLQKIFTIDGRRPLSTTRFYNGFGFDSMYMTTEGMAVQLCRRYQGQLNHMADSTPSPSGPFPRTPSRHSSFLHGRANTDRLD